jgi:hypothetical protein
MPAPLIAFLIAARRPWDFFIAGLLLKIILHGGAEDWSEFLDLP